MKIGRIDNAPIMSDIRKFTKNDLIKLSPDIVTAGFPCQDISTASAGGLGLKGDKSSLFYQILRIIDLQKSIRIVFLENSYNIVNLGGNGIDTVLDEFVKRGFRVTYVIQSAKDCGAPHRRLRWFALAIRNVDLKSLQQFTTDIIKHNWSSEPCTRVIHHNDDKEFKMSCLNRCQRLGNSVVPQAVICAWNTLVNQRIWDC
jgi:site-specific DNA-cytosine methylase